MNLKMLPCVLLLLLTSIRLGAIDTEFARVLLVLGFFAFGPFDLGQPEQKSAMAKAGASNAFSNLYFTFQISFQNHILFLKNILFQKNHFHYFFIFFTLDTLAMTTPEIGERRFENVDFDNDDTFEMPEFIEFYLWGPHYPDNVVDGLIGWHGLTMDDIVSPPKKTYLFNDLAMVVTLAENDRTTALLNTRFHGGMRVFLDEETFLKETKAKKEK